MSEHKFEKVNLWGGEKFVFICRNCGIDTREFDSGNNPLVQIGLSPCISDELIREGEELRDSFDDCVRVLNIHSSDICSFLRHEDINLSINSAGVCLEQLRSILDKLEGWYAYVSEMRVTKDRIVNREKIIDKKKGV